MLNTSGLDCRYLETLSGRSLQKVSNLSLLWTFLYHFLKRSTRYEIPALMFWKQFSMPAPRSPRLFHSAHMCWSNLLLLCVCACTCVCVCVYGAVPHSEPAGQLGAVWIVCCLPGGDIFNDFQTEPWAALWPAESTSSRRRPASPLRSCHLYFNLYTCRTRSDSVWFMNSDSAILRERTGKFDLSRFS